MLSAVVRVSLTKFENLPLSFNYFSYMFCDIAYSLEIIFKKLFCSLTCCITQGSLIHTVNNTGKYLMVHTVYITISTYPLQKPWRYRELGRESKTRKSDNFVFTPMIFLYFIMGYSKRNSACNVSHCSLLRCRRGEWKPSSHPTGPCFHYLKAQAAIIIPP